MTDNSYLKNIDNDIKAYCLGFFSYICDTLSKYSKNCYELPNIDNTIDSNILNIFEKIVDIIYDEDISITSMNIINDNILKDIKDNIDNFDNFTDKQKKEFIRGLYEVNYLYNNENINDICIKRIPLIEKVLDKIGLFLNIPFEYFKSNDETEFFVIKYSSNTIDFLGLIYNNIDNQYSFNYCNYNLTIPTCSILKTSEDAIIPSKEHWSDVGFDLSIISKIKDFNSKTSLYDTGIKIKLDTGYYAEIVPRSSISKTGYILANNVGIIDNSYRGNLMIALTKIADDAIDITFPFKCCQLIIKKQIYVNLEEVKDLDITKRNEGGFGSTNK